MSAQSPEIPVTAEELEELLALYNDFVDEWNRREQDRRERLPHSLQEWSSLVVAFFVDRDINRHVVLQRKSELERRFAIMVKGIKVFQDNGLSPLRNKIQTQDVRRAYSVTLSEGNPSNRKKKAA